MLFCYVPYHRLTAIKKKLENTSGFQVHYMDLLKHLLNFTKCKQVSWSSWNDCIAEEQLNVTRQRELPFANCQIVYQYMPCKCKDKLIEYIHEVDESSYIRYGCIPGSNQQLAFLSINATIVNVTTIKRVLPGIVLEACII
ncbi:GTP-binding nuclear protein [Dirofilaria immitis]